MFIKIFYIIVGTIIGSIALYIGIFGLIGIVYRIIWLFNSSSYVPDLFKFPSDVFLFVLVVAIIMFIFICFANVFLDLFDQK